MSEEPAVELRVIPECAPGDGWGVEMKVGVQYFALDYRGEDEGSAAWMAGQLSEALIKAGARVSILQSIPPEGS